MYRPPVTRRTLIISTFSFLASFSFTYECLLSTRNTRVVALNRPANFTQCAIWPDSPASGSTSREYEHCHVDLNTPYVGDQNVLGHSERCLPAKSRLDQYRSSASGNWSEVRWGEVQSRCASGKQELSPYEKIMHQQWRQSPDFENEKHESHKGQEIAVVLRTWDDYDYTENRMAWLRALIAEASLERKNNYRVFFLVNIKNPEVRLEEDGFAYDEMMRKCVPSEFRDIAFLFNERTLQSWYPDVPEHGAKDQMYQALQIFSHKFPQYEHIWQLEMDLRLTSHIHDTLTSATHFARTQKRQNLWERNGRFYIPALHASSYAHFTATVDAEIGDAGIWGADPASDIEPEGPTPPARGDTDWGVGEDADLVSFMPMIDPRGTQWMYEDDVHGFADGAATPRRAAIVSITRSSRRLLRLVSEAQRAAGQWVVSEATPETFALLHGLKAVTVPHPIVLTASADMTAAELEANINRGPPSNRAGGELPSLVYTYQGWIDGPWWGASYWFTGYGAQTIWDEYVQGGQFPPMLLHPVKEE
ncbi:hypothetical protein GGS24DRAFT_517937 [Hypoxylon argillaceum]|nr:hypothetical protein GGS24DRAFT_517937 [Hypoxylon argillaceum]